MNQCAPFLEDLEACLDRSLPQQRQRDVEAHIEHCDSCRAEYQRAAQLEAAIRSSAAGWQPSTGLWQRIRNSARQESAQSGRLRRPAAWMTAALLLITVGVTGIHLWQSEQADPGETVALALVNEFHTFVVSHRDLDFSDTQPTEIRNWFGDKVDFRVPTPIKSQELKLAGGRLCNMFDQRIASFMYQVDGAWVSLYIMRSGKVEDNLGASHELLLKGYGFIDWEDQGLHYSLVGDLPVERLREIAEHLRNTRILTNLPGPEYPGQMVYLGITPAHS